MSSYGGSIWHRRAGDDDDDPNDGPIMLMMMTLKKAKCPSLLLFIPNDDSAF